MKIIECKTIYVGGPISLGGTLSPEQVEENLQKFYIMESCLQAIGLAVFNPARLPKHNRYGEKSSQADYLEQCFWMIMQSDGMVVLEDWHQSHGTLREILMTQASGKPVFTDAFESLSFEVVPVVQTLAAS